VFLAVAAVMATIGEGVARTFIQFRPPDAYRLDIGGRIAGIAAFSLLSFLDAKPVIWTLIVAAVMLLLSALIAHRRLRRGRLLNLLRHHPGHPG
jgi:ABC-type antimicrobial peptide transport system permease subunit